MTIIWRGMVSFVALKVIDVLIGIRAKEEDEKKGLDQTHHGESGYNL